MAITCRPLTVEDKQKFLDLIATVSDNDAWNMNYSVGKVKPTEPYERHIDRHFEEKLDEYIANNVIHVMVQDDEIIGYSKMFISGDVVDIWDTYLIPGVRDKKLSHVAWKYMSSLGKEFVAHSNPANPGQAVSHDTLREIGFEVTEQTEEGPKQWKHKKNKEDKEE